MTEGRGKVLVVDDEQTVRDLLKRTLEEAGYEVVTAGSGLEALERVCEQEVGVVLLDIKMSGMTGMEVLGKPFDPEESEAMAVVPVEDPQQHDCVVGELRAGYRLGELTVRPAQVQVGRHPNGRPPESKGSLSEGTEPGC